jgi:septal ring factor EnvC (AmiA/AmiB activator)
MFWLNINDISTIVVLVIGVTSIVEKSVYILWKPHRNQEKEIKEANTKIFNQNIKITEITNEVCDLKTQITWLEDTLRKVKDNHLVHLQDDVNELKRSNVAMSTDIKWIVTKLNEQK